jgi:hypothetical protein
VIRPVRDRLPRRALPIVVAVLVAIGGVILILVFLGGRDKSQLDTTKGPGQEFASQGTKHLKPGEKPGVTYNSSPPTSGPHVPEAIHRDGETLTDNQILQALETGNVVFLYGTPRAPAALQRLADDVAGGSFDPALADAGAEVVLGRRPGTNGVIALAWRHLLHVPTPTDPSLRTFAEFWLEGGA